VTKESAQKGQRRVAVSRSRSHPYLLGLGYKNGNARETGMPKTTRKSAHRARRAPRRKRAARVQTTPTRTRAPGADEGHIDGCDIDFAATDLTADTALPEAKGGVEIVPRTRGRMGKGRRSR
jgi:hypothetical protein